MSIYIKVLRDSDEVASVMLTGSKLAIFKHRKSGRYYLFTFHGGMRPDTTYEAVSNYPIKLLLKMIMATLEDESWE